MKKGYYLTGLALLLTLAAQAQVTDSTYDNAHYRERMALFATLPAQKNAVVFLGNSITEAGKWTDLLPGRPVQNRGISGDVSYGVIARLPQIVAAKPAKVFLLIDVNDLKRGTAVEVIAQNYERMAAILRTSPKTKVYLQSVLPVNDSLLAEGFKKVTNVAIAALNKRLQQIASANGYTYVNLHEVFAGADGQLKKEDTADGIHLKVASYVTWVNYLRSKKYL